jgi:hypothetical protein
MAATASLQEAKKELLLRKKETEDTLGTMHSRLFVWENTGAYMNC